MSGKRPRDDDDLPGEKGSRLQRELNVFGLVNGGQKEKGRMVYTFGNYANYYLSYRHGKGTIQVPLDVRFQMLEKVLPGGFRGKRCLDVGCNNGIPAIMLASRFGAAWVVGVDIDYKLVNQGSWLIRRMRMDVDWALSDPARVSWHDELLSIREWLPSLSETRETWKSFELDRLPREAPIFPFNIELRTENFVRSTTEQRRQQTTAFAGRFEFVSAFSLTKWLHLHYGDFGVKKLFELAHELLVEGGHFALEPQRWESYSNKKTAETRQTIMNIHLKPHQFHDYLVDQLHFTFVTVFVPSMGTFRQENSASEGTFEGSSGFNRPIFVYRR
ncbi:MAG: uncharacterized protein KVP18_003955 [Porospora cf. gigantea A]|uniref:uncharacterized protein n=1 Tax=Porospora cf. gigantea A TaxID=2853593 RepID=UPI00355A023C|nr:MAG: hypothetical protein KVP18_003955 [Porospora cf. gigantea A]